MQVVFEWEYVRRMDEIKPTAPNLHDVEEALARAILQQTDELAARYVNHPYLQFFSTIADGVDYHGIAAKIIAHHTSHQGGKGALPYLRDGTIVVHNRVDAPALLAFLQKLKESPMTIEPAVAWRYKRDWHFWRAAQWLSYAGGVQ